jgi:hypothetical protein
VNRGAGLRSLPGSLLDRTDDDLGRVRLIRVSLIQIFRMAAKSPDLWHHKAMSNPSNRDDAENDGGGISSAITQDIELTVEQVEEAAKKAAHTAAVALGLSKDDAPAASANDTSADSDASASSDSDAKSKP